MVVVMGKAPAELPGWVEIGPVRLVVTRCLVGSLTDRSRLRLHYPYIARSSRKFPYPRNKHYKSGV